MRSLLALLALLLVSLPLAAAPGKAKGKGKQTDARFQPHEVRIIVDFYSGRSDLSPGIAKQLRRKGRLPPGIRKNLAPFPDELIGRLPPVPPGCRRAVYGGWALLVHDATNVVLDIIELTRR